MRILHVTAPAAFGGLESVVAGLARATADAGHDVTVALSLIPGIGEPAWASALRGNGVKVELIVVPARAYLEERRAVRALTHRIHPEVVHTHGYRSDVLHVGCAKRTGARVVSTAHGFASNDWRGRLYERLQLRAWRRFDAVVAVSEPIFTTLRSAGIGTSKLFWIANEFVPGSAPMLTRAAARDRLALPPSGTVIGWVGRFSEEKDPELMIRAFSALRDDTAMLCMVGDGPLASKMHDLAQGLGMGDRTAFPGSVNGIATCNAAFDVLALSSRTEGTPMVLLEAAHAGIPIVACAVGGVPALLGAEGGTLVNPSDAGALTRALLAVLGDPEGAKQRAEALRERLGARSSSADWVSRYLALYERAPR